MPSPQSFALSPIDFVRVSGVTATSGQTAATSSGVTPGLTVSFAEIELDTETGKFKILNMLCVADCGTVLHPQGLAHQIRGAGEVAAGNGGSDDPCGVSRIRLGIGWNAFGLEWALRQQSPTGSGCAASDN